MTFTSSISLLSAGVAFYAAVLSLQLSRAPGWREQQFFSLAAAAVALYTLLNVPTAAPIFSDAAVVSCSRLQFALTALHSFAWLRYSSALVGRPGTRTDRVLVPLLAVIGCAALTPVLLPGDVRVHTYEPWGVVYRSANASPIGGAAYGLVVGLLAVPLFRFARAWRRGVPSTPLLVIALAILMASGVNDTLVAAGLYEAPYLLDFAVLLPVVAVGQALTFRFVEDAREHDALQQDLKREVAERTADLGRTKDALHRAEKLASLGQFAAGVAHEVNNPAAVVNANLQYLLEQERDALSPNGVEAIEESRVAMQRVATIVRQLLDAGRLAASPEARTSVPVRPIGEHAFAVARARCGRRVRLANLVPEGVYALASENVLAQVIVNLVVNAVQAIPEHATDGQVTIRALGGADRVLVVVEDNGAGMSPDVLRRVFEPFFTTKPFGTGSGLGLAVSRGLVTSLGGELRLESAPGEGTRAIIELTAAPPPVAAPRAAERTPAAGGPRPRLLVVDDEQPVLTSLRRLLDGRYGVALAGGVDEALSALERERFDVVLCDVMMPAGGGERLYRSLVDRAPSQARRIVFLTGGAVTESARRFLRTQPQPVLHKPLDLDQLAEVAERLRAGEGASPSQH